MGAPEWAPGRSRPRTIDAAAPAVSRWVEEVDQHMTDALDGKVVIITGASSGIGEETARHLARLGCRLTLASRTEDRLRTVADALDGETFIVATDVTDAADVQRMVDRTVERFGRVDVMFANAGIYFPGDVIDQDPATWSKLMDVTSMASSTASTRSCRT